MNTPTEKLPRPRSELPAIRVVMMPQDTNPQGSVFGGVILSLIDQAAFVEALRQANHRYVTVAMEKVEFRLPVLVGDVLSLWAEATRIGRTSLGVSVTVKAFRPALNQELEVTHAAVTLVAVDESGRSIPVVSD